MPDNKTNDPEQQDLAKDMQFSGSEYVNMEGENRSTAKEGSLKSPEDDPNQKKDVPEESKEVVAPPDEPVNPSLAEDEKLDKDAISS